MNYLFHDATGAVHLGAAVIALVTGTWILFTPKGTQRHRKIGYVYFGSMVTLNLSAFLIYRLFGGFGVFHIAALLSLATVVAGIIPVIRRKSKNWLFAHLAWMYWSVMGLYAAFASEVLTRVPDTPFFGMVGYATGGIMLVGGYFYYTRSEQWAEKARARYREKAEMVADTGPETGPHMEQEAGT